MNKTTVNFYLSKIKNYIHIFLQTISLALQNQLSPENLCTVSLNFVIVLRFKMTFASTRLVVLKKKISSFLNSLNTESAPFFVATVMI